MRNDRRNNVKNITQAPRKFRGIDLSLHLKKYYKKIKSYKFKHMENGRSMTETLGVLVLIGILSLTALVGYRYAVDKYLTNDTLDEVNSRAVVAVTQLSRGLQTFGQEEFSASTSHGFPVETALTTDIEGFYIKLDNVPKGVCKQLANSGYAHSISINNIADTVDANLCIDSNTLRFTFKTEINKCSNDNDCPCGTCVDERCVSDCPTGTACATDYSNGTMLCCPYDKLANGYCCNNINEDGECCDEMGLCCPAEKPLINNNGKCVSCNGEQAINVTNYEETCARCSNRFLTYQFGNGFLCAKWCPSGQIPDYKGQCHTCDETELYKVIKSGAQNPNTHGGEQAALACPQTLLRYWGDHDISVLNCDSSEQDISVKGYPDTCNKCDNRVLVKDSYGSDWVCAKKCPADKPLLDTKGICHACSDSGFNIDDQVDYIKQAAYDCPKTLLSQANPNVAKVGNCDDSDQAVPVLGYTDMCSKCSNRVLTNVYGISRCALKCPANKPIMGEDGSCHSCDESGYRASISLNEAAIRACPYSLMKYDNPDVATINNCYDSAINLLVINGNVDYSDLCVKCPNRKINGSNCTLRECPDGYVKNYNGFCQSCTDRSIFVESSAECAKCPGKEVLIGVSTITCANPTCPNGQFRNIHGSCVSCDTSDSVQIGQESDCLVCPNRLAQGNYCHPNACKGGAEQQNNKCICPPDKPLMDWAGNCHPCGTTVEMWQGASCSVCPNMVRSGSTCTNACKNGAVNKNGWCVCPDDKPLIDWHGECHSCNEPSDINMYGNPNACDVCDGSNGQAKRVLNLKFGSAYPLCVLAD